MVVVGLGSIEPFLQLHPELRQEISELVRDLEAASIATPQDMTKRIPSVKIISGGIVVFKVRGNRFRLTARVAYNTQVVNLLVLEPHSEYDDRRFK
jgi:mRNA interferase HigB